MAQKPEFGPFASRQPIHGFLDISKKSYQTFNELIQSRLSPYDEVDELFLRMAYQAETTSLAIRMNNSWGLSLPALALTRVRVEQAIVCSYLLHVDVSEGLAQFFMYEGIGAYKHYRVAMGVPEIAKHLSAIDFSKTEQRAVEAQQAFDPNFNIENDKFERSWTKLDLRSMAKERDNLAKKRTPRFKNDLLEPAYVTIYKAASAIVHADFSSIWDGYLNGYRSPSGELKLTPSSTWMLLVAAVTADMDIRQCFEILREFDINAGDEYKLLKQESRTLHMQYKDLLTV